MKRIKLARSVITLLKYLGWTGAGAIVVALLNLVPTLDIPFWATAPISAILKSIATYIATEQKEVEPQ